MRKEITVTITEDGRDKGKQYFIRELPAVQAERWARRALAEIVRSGVQVPENIMSAGFVGLLAMGLRSLLGASGPEVDALFDEMMACVTFIPDPDRPEVKRKLIDDDTEEISTVTRLRDEVIKLHTDFSVAAFLREKWKAAKLRMSNSEDTPTSAESSAPSSPES